MAIDRGLLEPLCQNRLVVVRWHLSGWTADVKLMDLVQRWPCELGRKPVLNGSGRFRHLVVGVGRFCWLSLTLRGVLSGQVRHMHIRYRYFSIELRATMTVLGSHRRRTTATRRKTRGQHVHSPKVAALGGHALVPYSGVSTCRIWVHQLGSSLSTSHVFAAKVSTLAS